MSSSWSVWTFPQFYSISQLQVQLHFLWHHDTVTLWHVDMVMSESHGWCVGVGSGGAGRTQDYLCFQHNRQIVHICGNERNHQDDRKYILSWAQAVWLLVPPLLPDYPYSSVTFVSLLSSLPPALMATIQNKVNLSSFTSAGLNTGVAPSSLYPGLETFYDDQASQHIIGLMIYVIKLARVLTEYIIRTGKEGVEKNLLKSIMKIF